MTFQKKVLLWILKLFPLILLGFLIRNVLVNFNQVSGYLTDLRPIPLIFALLVGLTIYPEGGWAWCKVLERMGIKKDPRKVIYVWVVSIATRYIPGTIWQYVGRVELSRKELGIARRDSTVSLLAEIFFGIVAALVVSTFGFPSLDRLTHILSWWMFFIPLPLAMLHPFFSTRLMNLAARLTKRKVRWSRTVLTFEDSLHILPWFILNFLFNGLALFLLITAFGVTVGLLELIAFSGFYALAWLIGFVAVFAPGGVGVMETVLAYLLSFSMPIGLASTIALAYRFLLTLVEVLSFVIVVRLKR